MGFLEILRLCGHTYHKDACVSMLRWPVIRSHYVGDSSEVHGNCMVGISAFRAYVHTLLTSSRHLRYATFKLP